MLPHWFWSAGRLSTSVWRMAKTLPEQFGSNVRTARLAAGWTQEDLAHATGLATVQVSRIERGRREVRISTLVRLMRALNVSADELLSGSL